MSKNNIIGHIIHESSTTNNEIEVVGSKTANTIKFRAILQDFIQNRNNRIYDEDMLKEGYNNPRIQELVSTNGWYGELDHPLTKQVARQSMVLRERATHAILELFFVNNRVEGILETTNMGFGPQLKGEILRGHKAAFSMRGLGNIKRKGGVIYVNRPFRLITYDNVLSPSHKIAYMLDGGIINEKYDDSGHIDDYNHKYGNVYPITESDIKELSILSENMYDVSENLLTKDSKIFIVDNDIIVKNEEDTIISPLEEHVVKHNRYKDMLMALKDQ